MSDLFCFVFICIDTDSAAKSLLALILFTYYNLT